METENTQIEEVSLESRLGELEVAVSNVMTLIQATCGVLGLIVKVNLQEGSMEGNLIPAGDPRAGILSNVSGELKRLADERSILVDARGKPMVNASQN